MVLVKKITVFCFWYFMTLLTCTNAYKSPEFTLVLDHQKNATIPLKYLVFDEDYYFGGKSVLRESKEIPQVPDDNEMIDGSIILVRPSVRHHIAHFCPNLDVARTCIWGCMKEGKPAFCGKDHVCYCGHKYHPHQGKDIKQNLMNFQDLYEKYFGPNTNLNEMPSKGSQTTPKVESESDEENKSEDHKNKSDE